MRDYRIILRNGEELSYVMDECWWQHGDVVTAYGLGSLKVHQPPYYNLFNTVFGWAGLRIRTKLIQERL